MWLVFFGSGIGASISLSAIHVENYQQFIYPGILTMAILFSSIFFGVYIVWDKKIDFLKEVLISPLNRSTIFFGKVLGGATDGLIQSLILIVLGVAFFGIVFSVSSFILTIILVFLLTIGVVSIGLTIGAYMSSPEGFGLISSFVIFPLFFLSGALFPVSNLPSWMSFIVRVNPLTYGVDALRGVILGVSAFSLLFDLAVLIVFDVIMIVIGSVSFNNMKT
jgi:ABC-2 type transport system permease protein